MGFVDKLCNFGIFFEIVEILKLYFFRRAMEGFFLFFIWDEGPSLVNEIHIFYKGLDVYICIHLLKSIHHPINFGLWIVLLQLLLLYLSAYQLNWIHLLWWTTKHNALSGLSFDGYFLLQKLLKFQHKLDCPSGGYFFAKPSLRNTRQEAAPTLLASCFGYLVDILD